MMFKLPPLPVPTFPKDDTKEIPRRPTSCPCPGCNGEGKYKGTYVIGYEEDPCTWCDGWGYVPPGFDPPSKDGKDLFTKPLNRKR